MKRHISTKDKEEAELTEYRLAYAKQTRAETEPDLVDTPLIVADKETDVYALDIRNASNEKGA